MTLGLFPQETANALDMAQRAPDAPELKPGFLEGVTSAPGSGVEEGAAKTALALTPDHPLAPQNIGMPPIGAPDWAYKQYEDRINQAAKVDPEEYKAKLAQDTSDALKNFTPNPATTGLAGQILHGLVSGGTRLVGGSLLGGPLGGAVVVGATEGKATQRDLRAQGVDENTANALAAGATLFAGAGAYVPGGFGKTLLQRVATGEATQETLGIVNRGMMSKVLADNGYDAMAAQYRAFDGQAMLTDAALGMTFGALHHAMLPSVRDAAHTSADAVHIERDLAPGIPITPESRQTHVENITAAAEALLNERPADIRPVETIANPAQDALRAQDAADIHASMSEVTGEPTQAPAFVERRADAVESARLSDLRGKIGSLTDAEKNELIALQERDRLAAKVGGRRIQGLQSREAYEEMVARGEQLPHVAYFDLDMFKAINDKFGSERGDEAIRATGEAAAHYFGEGNAFKGSERAGDEFMAQGESPQELEAKLLALRQHLQNHRIQAYDKAGNLIAERQGVDFSYGIGHNREAAELASKADKTRRQRLGLRTDRGAVAEKPAADGGTSAGTETAGPEAGTGVTFKTAKGSSYTVHDDGTTTRNKAPRPEHPGDQGVQPRSEKTFYVTHVDANKLGEFQTQGDKKSIQTSGNQAAVRYESGPHAGKFEGRTLVNIHDKPAIGLTPVETWHGGKSVHFGNEITEVSEPTDRASGGIGDVATDELLGQAQDALTRNPAFAGLSVTHPETGEVLPAREALQAALDDLKTAKSDGELAQIAAACFGRG